MKKYDEYEIISVTSEDTYYPKEMGKLHKKPVLYYKGNIALVNAAKKLQLLEQEKYQIMVVR